MMKCIIYLFVFGTLIAPGCDLRKREQLLDQKGQELNQREQQLLLREKSLQLKEAQLLRGELKMDSSSNRSVPDTLTSRHFHLPGSYNVTMHCIETNCAGSAVGDTKNEQWQISFQNNRVIVKALSDKKLIRSYAGTLIANMMELTAQQDSLHTAQTGEIMVRLQQTRDNFLEGHREIIRRGQCRILYRLELSKQ